MSEWLDREYVAKVAPYLEKAKITSTGLQARCPSCGDSRRNQYKRRFGIMVERDGAYCHCFNCDYSNSLGGFLREFFPDLYASYAKAAFLEKGGASSSTRKVSQTRLSKRKSALFNEASADEVSSKSRSIIRPVSEGDVALSYVRSRRVRESLIPEIFVTPSYKSLLEAVRYDTVNNKVPDDCRVVVPLTKKDRSFGGFLGRVITDPKLKGQDSLRYSKNTFDDESIWIPKDLDETKPILVFEGLFDAAMFPNAVAVLSSNLQTARAFFPDAELIYVPDNEPDKPEIMTKLKRLIKTDTRAKVFIPNKQLGSKDLNHEVVDRGVALEDVEQMLQTRAFSFPRSLLEFNLWTNGAFVNA